MDTGAARSSELSLLSVAAVIDGEAPYFGSPTGFNWCCSGH